MPATPRLSPRVKFSEPIKDEEVLATPALTSFMRHAKTAGTADKMRELRQMLLNDEAPKAVSVLHEIMDSSSDSNRVKAASIVLEYTLGKVEGVQIPERPFVDLVLGAIAKELTERLPVKEAREWFNAFNVRVEDSLRQSSAPSAAARAMNVTPSYREDRMEEEES